LNGFAVRFARLGDGGRLNMADAYHSEWVGSKLAGWRRVVGEAGRPVVGWDAARSSDPGLGVTFAAPPALPATRPTDPP